MWTSDKITQQPYHRVGPLLHFCDGVGEFYLMDSRLFGFTDLKDSPGILVEGVVLLFFILPLGDRVLYLLELSKNIDLSHSKMGTSVLSCLINIKVVTIVSTMLTKQEFNLSI